MNKVIGELQNEKPLWLLEGTSFGRHRFLAPWVSISLPAGFSVKTWRYPNKSYGIFCDKCMTEVENIEDFKARDMTTFKLWCGKLKKLKELKHECQK